MSRSVGRSGAVVLVAVLVAALSGCVGGIVCPAIGYMYTGPAVLEFSEELADDVSVAACFGAECEPAAVSRDDGAWEVPQEAPYFESDVLVQGEERMLRVVVASSSGEVVSNEVHEIPVRSERTGVMGECPGPFSFEPVPIEVEG